MVQNKEEQLGEISVSQAKQYMEEGHFGVYNMLPKFRASVSFIEKGEGPLGLHYLPGALRDALKGRTGTISAKPCDRYRC